jgi:hypothetical protein
MRELLRAIAQALTCQFALHKKRDFFLILVYLFSRHINKKPGFSQYKYGNMIIDVIKIT